MCYFLYNNLNIIKDGKGKIMSKSVKKFLCTVMAIGIALTALTACRDDNGGNGGTEPEEIVLDNLFLSPHILTCLTLSLSSISFARS